MKCLVQHCLNQSHEGKFVGDLCAPCHTFLTTGEGAYSQLYRNTLEAERKRCHDFLMKLHMQAGGKHNYYHVAANQLLEEEP